MKCQNPNCDMDATFHITDSIGSIKHLCYVHAKLAIELKDYREQGNTNIGLESSWWIEDARWIFDRFQVVLTNNGGEFVMNCPEEMDQNSIDLAIFSLNVNCRVKKLSGDLLSDLLSKIRSTE